MQTIEGIQIDDEVAENLRLEAEATGKTIEEVAADRLCRHTWTGLGTLIASRFKGIGLTDEEHALFERAMSEEPVAAEVPS